MYSPVIASYLHGEMASPVPLPAENSPNTKDSSAKSEAQLEGFWEQQSYPCCEILSFPKFLSLSPSPPNLLRPRVLGGGAPGPLRTGILGEQGLHIGPDLPAHCWAMPSADETFVWFLWGWHLWLLMPAAHWDTNPQENPWVCPGNVCV